LLQCWLLKVTIDRDAWCHGARARAAWDRRCATDDDATSAASTPGARMAGGPIRVSRTPPPAPAAAFPCILGVFDIFSFPRRRSINMAAAGPRVLVCLPACLPGACPWKRSPPPGRGSHSQSHTLTLQEFFAERSPASAALGSRSCHFVRGGSSSPHQQEGRRKDQNTPVHDHAHHTDVRWWVTPPPKRGTRCCRTTAAAAAGLAGVSTERASTHSDFRSAYKRPSLTRIRETRELVDPHPHHARTRAGSRSWPELDQDPSMDGRRSGRQGRPATTRAAARLAGLRRSLLLPMLCCAVCATNSPPPCLVLVCMQMQHAPSALQNDGRPPSCRWRPCRGRDEIATGGGHGKGSIAFPRESRAGVL
jgi:hypothetical protein